MGRPPGRFHHLFGEDISPAQHGAVVIRAIRLHRSHLEGLARLGGHDPEPPLEAAPSPNARDPARPILDDTDIRLRGFGRCGPQMSVKEIPARRRQQLQCDIRVPVPVALARWRASRIGDVQIARRQAPDEIRCRDAIDPQPLAAVCEQVRLVISPPPPQPPERDLLDLRPVLVTRKLALGPFALRMIGMPLGLPQHALDLLQRCLGGMLDAQEQIPVAVGYALPSGTPAIPQPSLDLANRPAARCLLRCRRCNGHDAAEGWQEHEREQRLQHRSPHNVPVYRTGWGGGGGKSLSDVFLSLCANRRLITNRMRTRRHRSVDTSHRSVVLHSRTVLRLL